jgi:hypothetical protein
MTDDQRRMRKGRIELLTRDKGAWIRNQNNSRCLNDTKALVVTIK